MNSVSNVFLRNSEFQGKLRISFGGKRGIPVFEISETVFKLS
jgi:hypothetical protein